MRSTSDDVKIIIIIRITEFYSEVDTEVDNNNHSHNSPMKTPQWKFNNINSGSCYVTIGAPFVGLCLLASDT